MALNHLAFCTHDPELTHKFYTEAMAFDIVGIEADDTKGNKYKHVFYDAGDGSYLAYYDLAAFGTKALSGANTNITQAMGLGPAYMHVAWEAHNREGLEAAKQRWLAHGLEVMESDHHKDWMHSIYTFDPNGLMVECAYCQGQLPEVDAKHAYQLFVEGRDIDEIGYDREGIKPSVIHLPNPAVEKPSYYVSLTERMMKIDTKTAATLPFVTVVQH
ncbi:MAG: VOC family protein [Pseudomonadota bacterium]